MTGGARSRTALAASAAAIAIASGCSLLDLEGLQSGTGGASSSSSDASTSTTSTSTSTSTSSTVTTSTSASTTSGSMTTTSTGCTDMFCGTQPTADECADFDTISTTLGMGWNQEIVVNGGTTGSVEVTSSEFVSCPTSAVVDIVGVPSGRSWVQITNDAGMAPADKHASYRAQVKRTGPGAMAVDGTGILEIDYDSSTGALCQVFLQLFDGMSPGAYFFLQHWDGMNSATLTDDTLLFPTATANKWTLVEVDLDWSATPPTATATVDGHTSTITLTADCAPKPASIFAAWGVAYEDETQTLYFDDITATID